MSYDGATYDPPRDKARLDSQRVRTLRYLLARRGEWLTLYEIHAYAGGSENGVSARLRDLRKARFGGWPVESQRIGTGPWMYRMAPPAEPAQRPLFTEKEQPHVR